jgi:hypothetical protein
VALAWIDLHFSDPMLPEQVDVVLMADESFVQEERGSIPGLVHSNDEHPRL